MTEPAPVAEFSGTPLSGTNPLLVNFTDLSTGPVTSWSWTFGDGGTSTLQNPSHTYTAAGTYTVSLTATGPGGTDGETKVGYIHRQRARPGGRVLRDASQRHQPAARQLHRSIHGPVTSWSWTFGDGGTSTLQKPESHLHGGGHLHRLADRDRSRWV